MDVSHYAAVLGVDPERLATRQGQRHDVVIEASSDVAWRFPRTAAALAALPVTADRTRAAADLGLPVPSVVDVVLGPLGTARMGLSVLRGSGLSADLSDELGPRARARLVRDVVALLGRLRSVEPPSWPGSGSGWEERWRSLTTRLREQVVPLIGSAEGRRLATAELAAADRSASAAGSAGLVHGDLGGENLVLHPVAGDVVGVLDWDDAAPGDPAVDLAAILAHARPWLRDGLLTTDPSLQQLADRAAAYAGTFALQQALWGLESGDPAEVSAGLARYPDRGTAAATGIRSARIGSAGIG